jgi:hypothetical protein
LDNVGYFFADLMTEPLLAHTWLSKGDSLAEGSKEMRHSTTDITYRTYYKWLPKDSRPDIDELYKEGLIGLLPTWQKIKFDLGRDITEKDKDLRI